MASPLTLSHDPIWRRRSSKIGAIFPKGVGPTLISTLPPVLEVMIDSRSRWCSLRLPDRGDDFLNNFLNRQIINIVGCANIAPRVFINLQSSLAWWTWSSTGGWCSRWNNFPICEGVNVRDCSDPHRCNNHRVCRAHRCPIDHLLPLNQRSSWNHMLIDHLPRYLSLDSRCTTKLRNQWKSNTHPTPLDRQSEDDDALRRSDISTYPSHHLTRSPMVCKLQLTLSIQECFSSTRKDRS